MKEIINGANELVEKIREYSRSQKSLWQKVPFLALEADGRTGFSDHLARAYEYGFWALTGSISSGNYLVHVDLFSGDLIDAFSVTRKDPASNYQILKLAYNIEKLNAQRIIDSLNKKAKKPYSSSYNQKGQNLWRSKIKSELGLSESYVR